MQALRIIATIAVGIVLGALIALASAYYFLRSPAGGNIVRDYLIPREETLALSASSTSSNSASQSPAASSTAIVYVPKAFANEQYYIAINEVIVDVNGLNANNAELAPLLDKLNALTLSCTFVGFYDTMMQARSLIDRDQVLSNQFATHLTDLAAANTQTTDSITKSLTQDAYNKGIVFQQSLQTYTQVLMTLMMGDTPTSAQIEQLSVQINKTHAASQAFADALKPILTHFSDEIKRTLSSSPDQP